MKTIDKKPLQLLNVEALDAVYKRLMILKKWGHVELTPEEEEFCETSHDQLVLDLEVVLGQMEILMSHNRELMKLAKETI